MGAQGNLQLCCSSLHPARQYAHVSKDNEHRKQPGMQCDCWHRQRVQQHSGNHWRCKAILRERKARKTPRTCLHLIPCKEWRSVCPCEWTVGAAPEIWEWDNRSQESCGLVTRNSYARPTNVPLLIFVRGPAQHGTLMSSMPAHPLGPLDSARVSRLAETPLNENPCRFFTFLPLFSIPDNDVGDTSAGQLSIRKRNIHNVTFGNRTRNKEVILWCWQVIKKNTRCSGGQDIF